MSEFITDDGFWKMLRKSNIYREMSQAILASKVDLCEILSSRAECYMELSIDARDIAWQAFNTLNPEADGMPLLADFHARVVRRGV